MSFNSLREFIDYLKENDELMEIDEVVDWKHEVGAISRKGIDDKMPAIMFNKIKGYPQGYRIFTNSLGPTCPIHGRFALSLGLPKDTSPIDLINNYAERSQKRIKPVLVKDAPCKENIRRGEEVDLLQLPAPLIHEMDGGRFLGTWHIDVTKDPKTGWVNWGMYRHMVIDNKSLGWLANPLQHGPSIYYNEFEAKGKAMPMAIAIGIDPVSAIVTGTPIPFGVDEVDVAGAVGGKPVELVKCETVDLEVPASSEIVLEGYVEPYERKEEGPFGEYSGYCDKEKAERPVFRVTCITHRNKPILTMSNEGKFWTEGDVCASITCSASISEELKRRGISFNNLYVMPSLLSVVVSANSPYSGYAHTLAAAIWSTRGGLFKPFIIVVGEDVDVTNIEDVYWCLTTRMHPVNGIHAFKGAPAQSSYPFLLPSERLEKVVSGRVLFDATFPNHLKPDIPTIVDYKTAWSPQVRKRAEEILARVQKK